MYTAISEAVAAERAKDMREHAAKYNLARQARRARRRARNTHSPAQASSSVAAPAASPTLARPERGSEAAPCRNAA